LKCRENERIPRLFLSRPQAAEQHTACRVRMHTGLATASSMCQFMLAL